MGYTHKDWRKPRHRWAKMTNLQNAIDLHDTAFNGEQSRTLSNWEWSELKEICEEKALPEPTDRTLAGFIAIAGRHPQYFENGQWITPPTIKAGHGTMTAAPDRADRQAGQPLPTTSIGHPSTQESHESA